MLAPLLDGWYQRLRDAYLTTMADLGVHADRQPADFLTAMDGYEERDPELAIVVSAVKATVKGGLGKLRERPRGEGWKPGQPWRALSRPTWRSGIRAAVISRTRINLHRKMVKHAAFTGQYPVAVLSDCVVYAADGTSPLDFLPYRDGKPLPGGFKLGINPGLVKHIYAARLFDAQDAGANERELQQIAADALKEVYFQDGGRRAGSLEEVRFTDIEHLEFDF
ncbi:hypothetical protein [Streptomyces phaeoluteigriseus]|uniref:hypothetical protein n=1 Tax=Streptomyces phaeoluteigriseus TaxID=114686 RepID=UPI003EBDEECB